MNEDIDKDWVKSKDDALLGALHGVLLFLLFAFFLGDMNIFSAREMGIRIQPHTHARTHTHTHTHTSNCSISP